MKKIVIFLLASQYCLGINKYMFDKFKEEYPRSYFSLDIIATDKTITISDIIITMAGDCLTNKQSSLDETNINTLKKLSVLKKTGKTSALTVHELNSVTKTIDTLLTSEKFKKSFKPGGSDYYVAPLLQQYNWSETIDVIDNEKDKICAILFWSIPSILTLPADIIFGQGDENKAIITRLRQIREFIYYKESKPTKERIGIIAQHFVDHLRLYLGFIPLNDNTIIDPLKKEIINFLETKSIPETEDFEKYYTAYVQSLTMTPKDRYNAEKAYSAGLINALQLMHAANIEKDRREEERKSTKSSFYSSSSPNSQPNPISVSQSPVAIQSSALELAST